MQAWDVDEEVHLCVNVDDALLRHVFSDLNGEGDKVIVSHPEGKRGGFVDGRDVDLVIASIAQAHPYELSPLLHIDFE